MERSAAEVRMVRWTQRRNFVVLGESSLDGETGLFDIFLGESFHDAEDIHVQHTCTDPAPQPVRLKAEAPA